MSAFRKLNLQMTNSQITDFTDSIIVLGKDNTLEVDIGFLGKKSNNSYAGLVRDSETNSFVLIDSINLNNSQTTDISVTDISLIKGTLEVSNLIADTGILLPKGPTTSRPTAPVEGQLWFNTETKMFEGFNGTVWIVFIPAVLEITP